MATEIIMPKAGMAMEQGTIVRWLKSEGDPVTQGEALLEITTDKVNMEVEAEASGHLIKILHHEGAVLPVFTPIGLLGDKNEAVDAAQHPQAPAQKQAEKNKEDTTPVSSVKADSADVYDVIVIGAGPAGYVAAIKAAMLGGKVAVIEKTKAGGTCLNRGCVPTKTYVKNVEVIENLKKAGQRGITVADPAFTLDMNTIVANKNAVVNTLTTGVEGLLRSHGVKQYAAKAEAFPDKTVKLSTGEMLKGKKIILATGSEITIFPIPGIESTRILNSDELLDLKEVPQSLVVIGGGVIGCEFAEIFNGYGAQVTVVELSDALLPMFDRELSGAMADSFVKKGIGVKTSKKVIAFEEKNHGIETVLEDGERILSDKILMAVGRKPSLRGLEALQLKVEKGNIVTNALLETSVDGFYAAGDVNGRSMLAHAAFKMGEIAAVNAMGGDEKISLNAVPSCVYTLPEVASVGLTEEAASKRDIAIGRFNYYGNGRALASGEYSGFVKVIIDKKYHEILGVHIFGHSASELINEAAVLLQLEIPCEDVANCIHGHPSYSEVLMEACADALNTCIHLPKK